MTETDLSARMRAVAAKPHALSPPLPPPSSAAPGSGVAGGPGVPQRSHRVTVDLDDDGYAMLRGASYHWAMPATAVLRALLDEMASDSDLAARVRDRAERRAR
ncbi:MAG: hypothetical protein ACYCST_11360 [Acidimicrobiales bacterium]